MIGKEIIDKTESVEIPENKVGEITADRTSIEETKTFWNRVFYEESDEVSEESLWDEMMYCDELDFDFSEVVTEDTKKHWNCLMVIIGKTLMLMSVMN